MLDLLLVYPYFNDDHSIFKFPPLGLGYIASFVRGHGYSVEMIDCTFMSEEAAVAKARSMKPRVVGIYSMISMKETALRLAKHVRGYADLIIAGGPLPTTSPEIYLDDFDLVVIGEGEETVTNIFKVLDEGEDLSKVCGTAYRGAQGEIVKNTSCDLKNSLDSLPFPARDLYDHEAYKKYFRKYHDYTITSMITSRGCPFDCDFCSRPVFKQSYRSRSAVNIVDEMESIIPYGYDRIWISDDIFPISKNACISTCDEIIARGLDIQWECLCRADIMNNEIAARMRKAGCLRVFFGLESGNDRVLRLMNKQLTVQQAERAVRTVKSAGIMAGAFFILGYPGETNETMLDTIKFASSLNLDYLSFTVPYPIPGTRLYARLESEMLADEWKKPHYDPVKHILLYESEFSMSKLKFGMMKAKIEHELRRHFGSAYAFVGEPFEHMTDKIFKVMK